MSKIRGFTLIELIVVMVLMGILGGTVAVFFKPAIDSFFDARRRADMTDAADTALRKMAQDIRRAVPNSFNVIDGTTTDGTSACFRIVPTIGGGRYRTDFDTPPATPAVLNKDSLPPFNMSILSQQGTAAAENDFVVINNQNGDDVYSGGSRATVTAAGTPLTLDANPTASNYMGGRFQVVSKDEPSVMYTCANNTLTRTTLTGFTTPACATNQVTPPSTSAVLVAGNVSECTFAYGDADGLLRMSLVLRHPASGESITLGYAIHMDNTP
jgi:MSHA biogenesis protein MshO